MQGMLWTIIARHVLNKVLYFCLFSAEESWIFQSLFCSQESYPCERLDVATSCYLILGSDQYWTCLSFYLLHWGGDRSTIPSEQIFGWQQCSSLQFLWLHLQLPGGVTGLEQVEDADWFLIHQRLDYCLKLLLGVLNIWVGFHWSIISL